VGHAEIRLRTSNGGDSWIIEHTGTDYEYLQVYFYDENIGWILGTSGYWTGNPSVILYTDNNGVPVELVSFNAEVENNNVLLSWITATEINNLGFEVERKTDNEDWRTIGFVEGKGTTTEIQNYYYTDDLFGVTASKFYYRLKQIDYDGTFEYSEIIEMEVGIPTEFSLEQNYPNPFNPTTKINFQIPELCFVTLKVYDVLGSEIATLVNGEKAIGTYELTWYAEQFPSGIYFYKLQSGPFVETKKMILLK
jgi:hypothetical protein